MDVGNCGVDCVCGTRPDGVSCQRCGQFFEFGNRIKGSNEEDNLSSSSSRYLDRGVVLVRDDGGSEKGYF